MNEDVIIFKTPEQRITQRLAVSGGFHGSGGERYDTFTIAKHSLIENEIDCTRCSFPSVLFFLNVSVLLSFASSSSSPDPSDLEFKIVELKMNFDLSNGSKQLARAFY